MKRTIIQLSFGLGMLAFAAGCQDLYGTTLRVDGSTETRTLMQVLESRPEYSAFCEVVRIQGLVPCCPRIRPLRCGLRPMRPWRVM